MNSADKLDTTNINWITENRTQAVIDALRANGQEVRFVGGCVRDTILKRKVTDIDIATPDVPDKVMDLLKQANIKCVPTGYDHGTITAIPKNDKETKDLRFEITTLRCDVINLGRHAEVEYTDDWEADSRRRDFTMNALSLSPEGHLYDPYNGMLDIAAGHVKFVGNASRRIHEDYLRLLRFFRFHAYFGKGEPDIEAIDACRLSAEHLHKLSPERIRDEFIKLIKAPNPIPTINIMVNCEILYQIIPEVNNTKFLGKLLRINHGNTDDWLLRLASLLLGSELNVTSINISDRWRFSSKDSKRLTCLLAKHYTLEKTLDDSTVRRSLYASGKRLVIDWLILTLAINEREDKEYYELINLAENWVKPALPITGFDVISLGKNPGPEIGNLLETIEDWWINNNFAPDRQKCLEHLKLLAKTANKKKV